MLNSFKVVIEKTATTPGLKHVLIVTVVYTVYVSRTLFKHAVFFVDDLVVAMNTTRSSVKCGFFHYLSDQL